MKQIRTVKLQLKVDSKMFKQTLEAYTSAFNYVCQTAWDNQKFNGVRLHHLTYYQVRQDTGLKSQLAISPRVSEQYERLRGELQNKGTRSAKRHLAKISRSERLMRKDINHCITKQIVKGLEEGTTIVLEKLTGIRGGTRKLTQEQRLEGKKTLRKPQRKEVNKWNFFQFEQFLTYKAEARGCQVVFVDARYTSQRCSKCGHIHKGNRQKQSKFKCRNCDFQLNADLNASKNIVLKYLDATRHPDWATVNLPNDGLIAVNVPI